MGWSIGRKIKNEIAIWRQAALPGIAVLVIVIIARLTGSLQVLEWMTLDTFIRLRSPEPTDDKVVIIGINEADIRSVRRYPIPDGEIAALLKTVEKYKPRAIGLDIVRDIPIEPGNDQLVKVFQQKKNLIGIEKVLPPDQIPPPPQLSQQQVGFSDLIPDQDGKYRRYLLWTTNPQNPMQDKFSLSLRLAAAYLSAQGIQLETGIRDPDTIRFDTVEIPRFLPNSGGYVGANADGVKILLNFRSGREPFRILSLKDIKTGNFQPSWLRDRIVLIGISASSVPDFFNTSAIAGLKIPGQVSGVEFHAHACSQIIHAVLEQRPLLKVWSDKWEYLWIIIWGFVPIIIGRMTQSVWKNLLAVGAVSFCLVGVGYLLIVWGWWIPVTPSLLILVINSLGLSAFAFYQHDQALKSQIHERQRTIEHTFDVIHNGPLQTLANALRHMRSQDVPHEQLLWQFEKLNHEIREIGEYLKLKALSPEESLRLGSGLKLDLKRSIHELLYEVYTSTLERDDLEYLKTLKVKTRTFEPIDDKYLSFEQKRELCLFLEEALCNIGKHAKGAKRIEATGKENQGWYTLRIKDNGPGISSSSESKGTRQLKNIARNLGGYFKRESLSPKGTVCEISWQLASSKNHDKSIRNWLKPIFLRGK
ncbi:histidine kinase [Nostoc linckia z18]|jgi:CHASE2 domain-containing sensor protein|uniref:Histidine kinase n=2 Tax=Nostoc linckia TaxID=92942 RepID=A0A9Q5ZBH0_NOSLI|nr:CHASE2 domain-containing protein [Nostoc linckia]PHK41554.1 histidine kinase [Nostoc linckia z15]PHK45135.1 histidine kinase [Nostoc linckia z16]PHJ58485.1 histidine kinase [Nostoc linckia z1]PHJ60752.1 histidine kinase [Nostoc linckia z3]PHJ65771.1 histidine kinase [Nostoc linckia z2]